MSLPISPVVRSDRYLFKPQAGFLLRQPSSGPAYVDEPAPAPSFDAIWKEALRSWLPQCLVLFWPGIHAQIRWSVAPVFLDKELQQLGRLVRAGGKHVDALAQVQLVSGESAVLLIHLEIQAGRVTSAFPARMFQYYVRLLERHPGQQILSCAILLDSKEDSESHSYRHYSFGCELNFRFPVIHLAAWRERMAELRLQAATNPFAVMMLAQLEYRATRPDAQRLASKLTLVRALSQWNYNIDACRQLFVLLDSLLVLPEALNDNFLQILEAEETDMMNQMNSYERYLFRKERATGIAEGRASGVAEGKMEGAAELLQNQLEHKFGPLPDWASAHLTGADTDVLKRWSLNLLDAQRLEDVFRG